MKRKISSDSSSQAEVKLNLKKADEKIQSAELLYSKRFYNDSASRAYYAVFHAIVACLRSKKINLEQHKHNYILNQFRAHFIDTSILPVELYGKIQNIKASREQADYSIKFSISENDARVILEDARQILQNIQEHLALKMLEE